MFIHIFYKTYAVGNATWRHTFFVGDKFLFGSMNVGNVAPH